MTDSQDIALSRYHWYIEKSREIVALLPQSSQELLSSFSNPPSDPMLAQATLITFICFQYATRGQSPDWIASHLEHFFNNSSVNQYTLLKSIVLPVCERFRFYDLPFDNYWDSTKIHMDFLQFYIGCRIRDGVSLSDVKDELSKYWMLPRGATQEEFIDLASRDPSAADLSLIEDLLNNSKWKEVGAILRSEDFQATLEKYLSKNYPNLPKRPYLLPIGRFLLTTDIIRKLASGKSVPGLINFVEKARKQVGENIRGLGRLEMQLLIPANSETTFIEWYMSQRRKILYMIAATVPDAINGQIDFPLWIQDYVFSKGGRLYHRSIGPIPYLFLAIEFWTGGLIDRIGLGELELSDSWILIPIIIPSPDRSIYVPFRYRLEYIEDLHDLLLLASLGHVRLDIAEIDNQESLKMICSAQLPIPQDMANKIMSIVVPMLRERLEADSVLTLPTLNEHAGAGFLMCEEAKSEQMLVELQDFKITRDNEVHNKIFREYQTIKEKLLATRVKLAELSKDDDRDDDLENNRDLAKELEAKLFHVRERFRSNEIGDFTKYSPGRPQDKLANLSHLLESEERCFLHLTIKDEYLNAYWSRPTESSIEVGHIDLGHVKLGHLWDLTRQWILANEITKKQEQLVEVIRIIGSQIARPISDELVPRGVEHLIMSPTGFLELLPFHCAPISKGGPGSKLLCDTFEKLTYAPSLRILERLWELGPVELDSCVALAYSDEERSIPNASHEAYIISSLFPNTILLNESNATPENLFRAIQGISLLHLASHGEYDFVDHYSSGFQLYGEPKYKGWLSGAKILEQGNFSSVGLVVLAACESGRSFSRIRSVQNYSALDSFFLVRGARSALSTLWEIHDLASLLFMAVFYAKLLETQSIDSAYSHAVSFLRSKQYQKELPFYLTTILDGVNPSWRSELKSCKYDFSHPYFWGAFKCSGLTWDVFNKS